MAKIIQSVELVSAQDMEDYDNLAYSKIILKFTSGDKLTITAGYDVGCGSFSWFEMIGQDDIEEELVGKEFVKVIKTDKLVNLPKSEIDDFDTNNICRIILSNHESVRFLLRNSSNGFYSSWLETELKSLGKTSNYTLNSEEDNSDYSDSDSDLNLEQTIFEPNSIILLVGLPGCGKTSIINKNYLNPNNLIIDDISLDGDVKNEIKSWLGSNQNHKVIITNAKLCSNTYYNYLIDFLNISNKEEVFQTLTFDSNVYRCIRNLINREEQKRLLESYITSLFDLSKIYNPNNPIYLNLSQCYETFRNSNK